MNIILIGCGRIGRMHCDNVIDFFPEIRIQALFDYSIEHAYRNIPAYRPEHLSDYLVHNSVDAAIIAAPSAYHIELIKRVQAFGIPVFCEKPVSFDIVELDRLIEESDFVQVGLNRRWDPDFLRVKTMIQQGDIGCLNTIKITNRDPRRASHEFVQHSGGLLYDFTIHDFDMVHFLSESNVTEVFVQGGVLIDDGLHQFNDIDTALISMKMATGTLVSIDCSRETNAGYDQRLEVFGTKGSVSVDNSIQSNVSTINALGTHGDIPLPDFIHRYHQSYLHQLDGFFKGVGAQKSSVTLQAIRQAVLVASACQESLATGMSVELNVPESRSIGA